jgi:hypothetical protein
MKSVSPDPLNGRELADKLGVPGLALRNIIRRRKLMPGHEKGMRYRLDNGDQARIAGHLEVRALIAQHNPRRR